MTEGSFRYLSTLHARLIYPLSMLLDALHAAPGTMPNEVETGGPENGYAAATVVLAAMLIEATINVIRYETKGLVTRKTGHPSDYWAKISPYRELAKDIKEGVCRLRCHYSQPPLGCAGRL